MRDLEQELRERDQQVDDLLDVVRRQADEIEQLKTRIAELEATLGQRKEANASKPPKFSGNYSLSQQEKQRSGRQKKKSPGRRPNSLKLPQVQRTQDVYPDGVPPERCRFSGTDSSGDWKMAGPCSCVIGCTEKTGRTTSLRFPTYCRDQSTAWRSPSLWHTWFIR